MQVSTVEMLKIFNLEFVWKSFLTCVLISEEFGIPCPIVIEIKWERMRNENEKNMYLPGIIQHLRSTKKAKTSSADTGTKAEVWRSATIKNLLLWCIFLYYSNFVCEEKDKETGQSWT